MKNMDTQQKEELLQLLKDFYAISGQRTAIFNSNNQVILEYPDHHPFCMEIRKSPEGQRRCRESDLYGLKEAQKHKDYVIYRCHANLIEVCAPIKDECGIIGYLMFGQQILNTNIDGQRAKTMSNCADLIPDFNLRQALFNKIRRIDAEYLKASANILLTCASYICIKKLLRSNSNQLWIQIKDYVDANAADTISLKDMAKDLYVSVATICKTAKQYSGMTVIQLITNKRIEMAKKYLLNTSLPVNEIAALVGIKDYNYFSRLFKQRVGMSPRQFRNNKQN